MCECVEMIDAYKRGVRTYQLDVMFSNNTKVCLIKSGNTILDFIQTSAYKENLSHILQHLCPTVVKNIVL